MKDQTQKKNGIALARKYGFITNVPITPGEANKYDQIITKLTTIDKMFKTTTPTDIHLLRTMLSDHLLRETAITIRRTPKNLIEVFTDDTKPPTLLTRIMRYTSIRYHEKNNSNAYFKIKALSLAMTPHNVYRLVSAIKAPTNEHFNAELTATARKTSPFGRI